MSEFEKVKKKLISKLFAKSVEVMNREVDLEDFKSKYFPDEDRTMAMRIKGLEDLPTGFVFEEGQIRLLDVLTDTPTVEVFLDEDTFLAICCEELTMSQAYMYGMMDLKGENYMRDYHIFEKMFSQYPSVLGKMNPKKKKKQEAHLI